MDSESRKTTAEESGSQLDYEEVIASANNPVKDHEDQALQEISEKEKAEINLQFIASLKGYFYWRTLWSRTLFWGVILSGLCQLALLAIAVFARDEKSKQIFGMMAGGLFLQLSTLVAISLNYLFPKSGTDDPMQKFLRRQKITD